MSNTPLVTFITSTKNNARYFKFYINELVNQTIFNKCEIIFVDSNSKENESELMMEYIKKYNNIKLLILSKDKGLYNSWNQAIRLSSGKYITNASMDDRRSIYFSEKLSNFLEINEDVDLVYTENYLTYNDLETFENNTSNGSVYAANEFSVLNMLNGNPPHVMPMWRSSIHKDCGLFLETYPSCSDYEFWLRCTFLGKKFHKFQEKLGLYYHNPNGLSTNSNNDLWKIPDENYVRNSYIEFYNNIYRGDFNNVSFFNWWKQRNWKTNKRDFI